jgi:hypothetical protein
VSNKNNQSNNMNKKEEVKRRLKIWIRIAEDEEQWAVAKGLINEVLGKLLTELKRLKGKQ